ncbi:hypothetical protein MTO96_043564 [Rhipicephalus appendiculatus]
MMTSSDEGLDEWLATRRPQGFHRLPGQMTEFLWQKARLTLPSPRRTPGVESTVTCWVTPAFLEPSKTLSKRVGSSASNPRPPVPSYLLRCDASACTLQTTQGNGQGNVNRLSSTKDPLKRVVSYLKESALFIMEADKEGVFVVIPQGMFKDKARRAVQKNVRPVDFSAKLQRKRVIKKLKEMNLDGAGSSA